MIRRALAAGHRPRSVLLAERWLTASATCSSAADVVPSTCDEPLLHALTGFDVHRGALAAMERLALRAGLPGPRCPPRRSCSRTSSTPPTSVPSSGPSPPWASTPSSSPHAAPTRCTGGPSGSRWVRCSRCRGRGSTGGPTASPSCARPGSSTDALARRRPITPRRAGRRPPERSPWCSAPRGDGLNAVRSPRSDLGVRIPMAGGVDSLNVAAAAAVAFWALRVRD